MDADGGKDRGFDVPSLKPSKSTSSSKRDRDREREKERERERERESQDGTANPSRRSSIASGSLKPTPKDTHAAERDAKNRDRLVKEAQRMMFSGIKRSRDGGDDGRKDRRKSRRSEAVNVDESEERLKKLEAEREAARWE